MESPLSTHIKIKAVTDALIESEAKVLISSASLLEKTGAAVSTACADLKAIVYAAHENPATPEKLDKINPNVELVKFSDLVASVMGSFI